MILFLDQSGQLGGAELCLFDLVRAHKEHCRVVLLSPGPFEESLRAAGIPVEVLPLPESAARAGKSSSLVSLVGKIPSLVTLTASLGRQFRKADLLYFNTAKALLLGTSANLVTRKPVVFHLHDLWEPRHFSPAAIRLLVTAANRARIIIANSQIVADTYRGAGGTTPVRVIPNGFDIETFSRAAASGGDRASLRRKWNPSAKPVIALFGRLARWKGQDVLLRAVKDLPEVTVWIVGDALYTGEDREFAAALKAQAQALGNRVQFLGFRRDIPALMAACDIVVHCSTAAEPFGRVLVEAMLAGRPVIASDAGGPREILAGGECGLLVPPGDSEALRQALADLLHDAELARSLAKRGRARAEHEYGLTAVLQRSNAVLKEALTPE